MLHKVFGYYAFLALMKDIKVIRMQNSYQDFILILKLLVVLAYNFVYINFILLCVFISHKSMYMH